MIGGGSFDAYAVTTRSGPHVTMQAGVVHLGRHWTTATRHSVKAAAIRRCGQASAVTAEGAAWRVLRGPAVVLDPAHPSTIIADPVGSLLAGGAVLRLGLQQLDQLAGYAEAGTAVPLRFLPTGRVVLVTRINDELVLDGDEIVRASGRWDRPPANLRPARRSIPAWDPDAILGDLPAEIGALGTRSGRAWLGVETAGGAVALPGHWDAATGRVSAGRAALGAVRGRLPGRVCVTLDDSHERRPDEKLGMMLRGTATVADVDDVSALLAIDVARVTHWEGFTTSTASEAA